MGPTQLPPNRQTNQERNHRTAKRHARRPRRRRCLLKGCERQFRPQHPWSRYCGADCRSKARRWSRWKAQKRYRATGSGKRQRKAQSCRYRERACARKRAKPAASEHARVITAKNSSSIAATGQAAMCRSCGRAVLPCSASARRSAGARWSASWSGNGAGGNAAGRKRPCRALPGLCARPDGSGTAKPSCS